MPAQCHLGHQSENPADGHGCIACDHAVIGPAVGGSDDVFVNGEPALRAPGDPGVHSSCCGPNEWVTDVGSSSVFINGLAAVRNGDATIHCGGNGSMVEGSGDVTTGG